MFFLIVSHYCAKNLNVFCNFFLVISCQFWYYGIFVYVSLSLSLCCFCQFLESPGCSVNVTKLKKFSSILRVCFITPISNNMYVWWGCQVFFFFFSKIIFVKLIGKEISWNSGSSSRLYRMSAELVHTEVLDTNIFKLHIFLLYLLTWLCFVMYHLKRNFPPPEILHSCKHFNWNFWFLPSFFFFFFFRTVKFGISCQRQPHQHHHFLFL